MLGSCEDCFSTNVSIVLTESACIHVMKCSKQVKEPAYLTMVRPQLEYASAVWDPYHVGDISELEKV